MRHSHIVRNKETKLPTIARAELKKLTEQGRTWHVYARKRIAVVDGFKRYKLID